MRNIFGTPKILEQLTPMQEQPRLSGDCFGVHLPIFFDYFAWYKENGKNWDHWVGTL